MALLHLQLLGTFHLSRDGAVLTSFRSDKARALLAFLALEADRPHRREALVSMFWPDQLESRGKANLRQTLSRLNRALHDPEKGGRAEAPLLEISRHTLQFNAPPHVFLDTRAFLGALAEVEAHPHADLGACPECRTRLEEAAALFRGEVLQGLSLRGSAPFEEWLLVERERFRQRALELMHTLAALLEQDGEYARAQFYARRQLALEGWRERAHRQLIRALALQGERGAALAQFEACRTLLAEELGVEPAEATIALAARVRAGELGVEAPQTDVPQTDVPHSDGPTHNLPTPTTPFIGREVELGELAARLADPAYRLVTLVGLGGIGKTRLALEAARAARAHFKDGVFFVPLAGVDSAQGLPSAVAQALGLIFDKARVSPRDQVLSALERREILLVLDNFEHLMDGVELVLEMVRRAPNLVLLVTSRERLGVRAEDLYSLHGLPVPGEDDVADAGRFASVRLFLDRARRLDKRFRLDRDTAPGVARICRAVEGMPLALELAAAWIGDMRLCEIGDAIEQNLDLFTTDLSDAPTHQRSLRRVFERSWDLLAEEERAVFARLSIFRSSFSARAAAEVARAALASLTRLRYKTLVRRSDAGRYSVHELLRQFTETKLGPREEAGLRTRHGDYYLGALAEQSEMLQGEAPKAAADALRPDLDNVRQAWRWAVANERLAALTASVDALEQLYALLGLDTEGEEVFAKAAQHFDGAAGEGAKRFRARALLALCRCQRVQGKYELSIETAREAARLAEEVGECRVEAKAYLAWGNSSLRLQGPEVATRLLETGLVRARAGAHAAVEADLLINLGFVHDAKGEVDAFERCLEEALDILKRIDHLTLEQAAVLYLGLCQFQRGSYGESRETVQRALDLSHHTGFTMYEASSADLLGRIEQALGRLEHARALHERSLELSRAIGYRNQENHALHHLCAVYRKLGQWDRAEAHGREALEVGRAIGTPEPVSWAHMHLGYVFLEQGRLLEAHDAFVRAKNGWDTLGEEALSVQAAAGLAEALVGLGERERALEVVEPALTFMDARDLAGTDEPARILLSCYRALTACRDARAPGFLTQARALMERRSAQIADPALRRSYLQVAENRALAAL